MRRRLGQPDRFIPTGVFVVALAWHWLQGRWLPTPVLLPDELRAADGANALLEGARGGAQSLYSLVSAPLWLGSVGTGYALAKLAGALLVAASSWPAYRLARLGAGPVLAGFAAAAAVLAPATLAASLIGGLALAYPVSALATLWLAQYLASGDARSGAASLGGFALAAAAWPPLVLLLLAAVIVVAARSFRARRLARWPGAAVLIAVPALAYAGYYVARAASPAFATVADGGWSDLPRSSAAGLRGVRPRARRPAGDRGFRRRPRPQAPLTPADRRLLRPRKHLARSRRRHRSRERARPWHASRGADIAPDPSGAPRACCKRAHATLSTAGDARGRRGRQLSRSLRCRERSATASSHGRPGWSSPAASALRRSCGGSRL